MQPRRILHTIAGLAIGGAETMLLELVERLPEWEHHVLSLQAGGPLVEPLIAAGAVVHTANMPRGRPTLAGMLRVRQIARRIRPTLVQGWTYHGNLAALWAAKSRTPSPPQIWSIHNAAPDLASYRPHTRLSAYFNGKLCPQAFCVVYVAQSSLAAHQRAGFANARMLHIPLGVDATRYAPVPGAAAALRQRLGIAAEAPIIGIVARFDPLKDHATFLAAARTMPPAVHFVIAGPGMAPMPTALRPAAALAPRLHWLPTQRPIQPLLAGLSLCTLSSRSEAMPMILLEALACGTPCVATDVGDCALMLGRDAVVPPGQPMALAHAWQTCLEASPEAMTRRRLAMRADVVHRYSIEGMLARFQSLYEGASSSERSSP